MRFSRRAALAGGGAFAAATVAGWTERAGPAAGPMPIQVRTYPIEHFAPSHPERRRFGALTFRAGLELQSRHREFGGFSGLWRSPDGTSLVALSDNAHWFTARVESRDGLLAGLGDTAIAPLLGQEGEKLSRTWSYDTEALAIVDGVAYVGIERTHEIVRFDWAKGGVNAGAQPIPVPREAKALRSNKGLEAIAVAPPAHPLAGALIAVAEQARSGAASPTRAFILTGPRPGLFDLARSDSFDVTDIAFLASSEMLVLERRFSIFRGVAVRIRRIPAEALAPGALADGPVIFSADSDDQLDNMEGLALHQGPAGETVVTLISDDNFSVLQRTLLLEFTLEA